MAGAVWRRGGEVVSEARIAEVRHSVWQAVLLVPWQ
jgi:hypothetical protein